MVQDIAPHRFDNAYHDCAPGPEDTVFLFDGEEMLAVLSQDGQLSFPRLRDFDALDGDVHYLFALDGQPYFLALPGSPKDCKASGFTWLHAGKLRGAVPAEMAFIGITARQLWRWYQNNRFCSHCGNKLHHDKKERMLYCSGCGNMVYPKISPCVIVAITDGDKILLTKYARSAYSHYALVAGFCEIGESLEATVHREVAEEVGLQVENLRYWKSQPWAFSDTLLAGFYCDVVGDPTPKLVDGELREATWFDRREIPVKDDGVSLTRALIENFRLGKELK